MLDSRFQSSKRNQHETTESTNTLIYHTSLFNVTSQSMRYVQLLRMVSLLTLASLPWLYLLCLTPISSLRHIQPLCMVYLLTLVSLPWLYLQCLTPINFLRYIQLSAVPHWRWWYLSFSAAPGEPTAYKFLTMCTALLYAVSF